MPRETIELISAWVTILGLPITVVTLILAYVAFARSKKIEEARFWLELREHFLVHNEVHLNLRNGGKWANSQDGPQSVEEWAKVDAYLGQFELCELMLEQNLINKETFKTQYRYRLHNILQNQRIVDKLEATAPSWKLFISLCASLGFEKIGA
jgi:hypothetical protein